MSHPHPTRRRAAGDGNRTHVSSLEGWCSTIELHPQMPIGVTGFEPAASCSQSRRSSQAEPHPVAAYSRLSFIPRKSRNHYYIHSSRICQSQKSKIFRFLQSIFTVRSLTPVKSTSVLSHRSAASSPSSARRRLNLSKFVDCPAPLHQSLFIALGPRFRNLSV